MIIFVNGAFGVGKTTVANLLLQQVPNSMLYDPEIVGEMLRWMTDGALSAAEQTDNFQDIALWPTLTVTIATHLRRQYQRHFIVPMTITNRDYFATICAGLRQLDPDFHHFSLLASHNTIHQRLAQRGDELGGWSFLQTERCVTALQTAVFATHLDAETHSPSELADIICQQVGIATGPS